MYFIPVKFLKFSWGRQRAKQDFWPFLYDLARGENNKILMGETFLYALRGNLFAVEIKVIKKL